MKCKTKFSKGLCKSGLKQFGYFDSIMMRNSSGLDDKTVDMTGEKVAQEGIVGVTDVWCVESRVIGKLEAVRIIE